MDVSLVPKSRKSALLPPSEEIQTEAQKQLKTLVQKQLNKDVTIQQQLSQKRSFASSSFHDPAVSKLSGLVKLEDFASWEDADSYITELKGYGLTLEEIELKLTNEYPKLDSGKKPRYGIDPSLQQSKLEEIERKIEEKKNKLKSQDVFYGQKILTRHEMEVEKSLLRESSVEGKKLSSMLTAVKHCGKAVHPDDPMNHLEEILETVTNSNKPTKKADNKKKHKNKGISQIEVQNREFTQSRDHRIENVESVNENREECSNEVLRENSRRLTETNLETQLTNEADTCNSRLNCSEREIQGKKTGAVELQSEIAYIPECDIVANRLSVGEIKALPRFENYSAGTPNKTLYLKNLSPKVTPEDLVSVFGRFQESGQQQIVYRLMSGRMKGQGFVEFKDEETAAKALILANGYMLKGKPMVIQYGRKKL
ncbi:hypothetical protein FSP39_005434 [Pinctada imbricata]|uniref:RRM domain-containing protein n=1 Tax=Pinctada imbricata TaxID=66713 RepID=A0AA88Y6R5_PINIB|nr:hypothetical protein FSP39_005434 [Pinctada imbricata]